jgi:hypothetical protein
MLLQTRKKCKKPMKTLKHVSRKETMRRTQIPTAVECSEE